MADAPSVRQPQLPEFFGPRAPYLEVSLHRSIGLGCHWSQVQVAARARKLGIADYDDKPASKSGDKDDDVFVLKIG